MSTHVLDPNSTAFCKTVVEFFGDDQMKFSYRPGRNETIYLDRGEAKALFRLMAERYPDALED